MTSTVVRRTPSSDDTALGAVETGGGAFNAFQRRPEADVTAKTESAGEELTRIAGIGSQIAARLHKAGIRTIDQLANATTDQVVTICGRNAAGGGRAQSWIDQAAELAGVAAESRKGGAAAESGAQGTADRMRPPRRTFTVEVRVDGDPAHVVTTRVVHLETQEADGWPGWSRARLLDFLEARLGVTDPQVQPVPRSESPAEEAEVGLAQVDVEQASPPPLRVHRFGLLKAPAPLLQRGGATARLLINPAALDLPAQGRAVAYVELLARALGAGRDKVLDTRMIDLSAGAPADTLLRGRLPEQDPPFAISATVRVLVDQPNDRPREGLGSASLELVADGGRA